MDQLRTERLKRQVRERKEAHDKAATKARATQLHAGGAIGARMAAAEAERRKREGWGEGQEGTRSRDQPLPTGRGEALAKRGRLWADPRELEDRIHYGL